MATRLEAPVQEPRNVVGPGEVDLAGVAVSSGAACSSGKVAPSHVLAAMGVPGALARGAVRVSLGYATQEADIERFLAAWRGVAETLSKESRGMAA